MQKVALIIVCLICGSAMADNTKGPPMDAKMQAKMAEWKKYSTPGTEHTILKDLAGKWKYTMTGWMEPGAKPETSTGTANNKVIMDGRFLKIDATGKMNGQPFEGTGMWGHNNMTQEYETTWVDNMGTGMMKGTGSLDKANNTIKENGTFSCPITGQKERNYRGETKIADKNNYSYEMFAKGPDGKEFKMMELKYTRIQ